jgi:NAD(P)-dependent dehydrogenase (short-subunit alcohol dehydrogenase family)
MIAGTPLGRIGQPDDIARVAVFLASEDSAWLTDEPPHQLRQVTPGASGERALLDHHGC